MLAYFLIKHGNTVRIMFQKRYTYLPSAITFICDKYMSVGVFRYFQTTTRR